MWRTLIRDLSCSIQCGLLVCVAMLCAAVFLLGSIEYYVTIETSMCMYIIFTLGLSMMILYTLDIAVVYMYDLYRFTLTFRYYMRRLIFILFFSFVFSFLFS